MAYSADDVTESGRHHRRCQELDDEPSPTSLATEYVRALGDDDDHGGDDSGSGLDSVEHLNEELSPVFDAAFRSPDRKYDDAVFKQRPSDCVGDSTYKRRKRSPAAADYAAELFPVPVVTSSSHVAVTCQPGVGRLLLLTTIWLPWLLSMTSFCLAAALPVDSDALRSPMKVFDGSANNADVDGPVSN